MGDSEEPKEEAGKKKSRLWTPDGGEGGGVESGGAGPEAEGESEEMSDEELRRRMDEAMEKITVADVIIDMMVSLSSLAYQRMGIPHEVNEKYRDMEQARMAIDCLDALATAIEGRIPDEVAKPLTGTLDNLKLNFAKES